MPELKNNKTILVAPLDWGLGHATRCIPLIRELLQQGCRVLIGASGPHAALLRQEFPQLTLLPLQGYGIRYGKGNLMLQLLRQLPRFLRTIRQEHRWLQKMIGEHQVDGVISDNRYGLYSAKVPCIIITHQLQVQAPRWLRWLEQPAQKNIYRFLQKFSECWVPDVADADTSLGKKLSHPQQKPTLPVQYIGWLTRLVPMLPQPKKYNLLISLSGPEPQRTLLENKLLNQLSEVKEKVMLVRGLPDNTTLPTLHLPNVSVFNHLSGIAFQEALAESEVFLSRCGYSTLMDLQTAACRCIFIPTPGQTEQEYLAEQIKAAGTAVVMKQDNLDVRQALQQARTLPSFSAGQYHNEQLPAVISHWLATLR